MPRAIEVLIARPEMKTFGDFSGINEINGLRLPQDMPTTPWDASTDVPEVGRLGHARVGTFCGCGRPLPLVTW
jgi:hypothetical protein